MEPASCSYPLALFNVALKIISSGKILSGNGNKNRQQMPGLGKYLSTVPTNLPRYLTKTIKVTLDTRLPLYMKTYRPTSI